MGAGEVLTGSADDGPGADLQAGCDHGAEHWLTSLEVEAVAVGDEEGCLGEIYAPDLFLGQGGDVAVAVPVRLMLQAVQFDVDQAGLG